MEMAESWSVRNDIVEERVGDDFPFNLAFTGLEESIDSENRWPPAKMDDRPGELLKFGIVCDLVTPPTPPIIPKLLDLSLSPGSSIFERGLHSF